jgi:hypothetical protein
LRAFIASTEKDDQGFAMLGVIKPIPRPDINSQLGYPFAHGFAITEVTRF